MVCRSAHRQGDKAKVEWALDKLVTLSSQIFATSACKEDFNKELIAIILTIGMKEEENTVGGVHKIKKGKGPPAESKERSHKSISPHDD